MIVSIYCAIRSTVVRNHIQVCHYTAQNIKVGTKAPTIIVTLKVAMSMLFFLLLFCFVHYLYRLMLYLDYITVSSNIMFSMKYGLSINDLLKQTLYNNIRTTDYPECPDYLEGLTIVSCDYKDLFIQYKDEQNVVFLVDPPYLSTEVGTYNLYWRLSDYLDVLTVLAEHPFVYFTSNKSSILELCDWMGKHQSLGNPFVGCEKVEFNAHMNYNAQYTDVMLYKKSA